MRDSRGNMAQTVGAEAQQTQKSRDGYRSRGRVVQILGAVVDVEFPPGGMPEIYEGIEVPREGQGPLVLEVQMDLGGHRVRTVAMESTGGLPRGVGACRAGTPIRRAAGATFWRRTV